MAQGLFGDSKKMNLFYRDRAWDVKETGNSKMLMGDIEIYIPASWHLVSEICTISMPKNANETFHEFKERLKNQIENYQKRREMEE